MIPRLIFPSPCNFCGCCFRSGDRSCLCLHTVIRERSQAHSTGPEVRLDRLRRLARARERHSEAKAWRGVCPGTLQYDLYVYLGAIDRSWQGGAASEKSWTSPGRVDGRSRVHEEQGGRTSGVYGKSEQSTVREWLAGPGWDGPAIWTGGGGDGTSGRSSCHRDEDDRRG